MLEASHSCCHKLWMWTQCQREEWNGWLGSQSSELTSCSTSLQSDSTESRLCLGDLRERDPAGGLCRFRSVRHKAESAGFPLQSVPARGFNGTSQSELDSQSYVYLFLPHGCSHTWLSCWMDCAHVGACDWRRALEKLTCMEVFMAGRDYVLWRGNLPRQSYTLLSDYYNPAGKSTGGTDTETHQ